MMTTIICTAAFLSAVLLYLFLIFPSVKGKLSTEFTSRPIAHRGLHGDFCPENSLAAFSNALSGSVPVEFDVRLTCDGIPVVFHDKDLSRMCGAKVLVTSVTCDELQKYQLSESGETIPTLAQVLETVDGRVPLLIELKGEDRSDVASCVAEVLKEYKGEVAVESFNPYHLMRFRRKMPHIPLGILSGRKIGKTPFTVFFGTLTMHMLMNFLFRPDFIAFRYTDSLPLGVKLCRRLGVPVIGWTFYGKESCFKEGSGFDGHICDGLCVD